MEVFNWVRFSEPVQLVLAVLLVENHSLFYVEFWLYFLWILDDILFVHFILELAILELVFALIDEVLHFRCRWLASLIILAHKRGVVLIQLAQQNLGDVRLLRLLFATRTLIDCRVQVVLLYASLRRNRALRRCGRRLVFWWCVILIFSHPWLLRNWFNQCCFRGLAGCRSLQQWTYCFKVVERQRPFSEIWGLYTLRDDLLDIVLVKSPHLGFDLLDILFVDLYQRHSLILISFIDCFALLYFHGGTGSTKLFHISAFDIWSVEMAISVLQLLYGLLNSIWAILIWPYHSCHR